MGMTVTHHEYGDGGIFIGPNGLAHAYLAWHLWEAFVEDLGTRPDPRAAYGGLPPASPARCGNKSYVALRDADGSVTRLYLVFPHPEREGDMVVSVDGDVLVHYLEVSADHGGTLLTPTDDITSGDNVFTRTDGTLFTVALRASGERPTLRDLEALCG